MYRNLALLASLSLWLLTLLRLLDPCHQIQNKMNFFNFFLFFLYHNTWRITRDQFLMKKLKEPSFRQLFLCSKKNVLRKLSLFSVLLLKSGLNYLFVYGNTYILKKQCHEIFGIIYLFLQRLLSIKFEKFDTALF